MGLGTIGFSIHKAKGDIVPLFLSFASEVCSAFTVPGATFSAAQSRLRD